MYKHYQCSDDGNEACNDNVTCLNWYGLESVIQSRKSKGHLLNHRAHWAPAVIVRKQIYEHYSHSAAQRDPIPSSQRKQAAVAL